MTALRDLQHSFLDYLLDTGQTDIEAAIESTPMRSAGERMALYGTAYRLRLKEALSTDFERLHAYLGDETFDRLMDLYIDRHPSHHPSLRYFGQHMAVLLEQQAPFSQHPQIAELARIELAFANSFDAADCGVTGAEDLAALDPQHWATLGFRFHASLQLLAQTRNSFEIWKALSDEQPPPECTTDTSVWLIWRKALVSRYRPLSAIESRVLEAALQGATFADICEYLLDSYSEEETPLKALELLQQWLRDGMICELVNNN